MADATRVMHKGLPRIFTRRKSAAYCEFETFNDGGSANNGQQRNGQFSSKKRNEDSTVARSKGVDDSLSTSIGSDDDRTGKEELQNLRKERPKDESKKKSWNGQTKTATYLLVGVGAERSHSANR
jgi:hypothetical protein